MVHLLTVSNAFEARVVAARLGSEGITVTLRGAVDGPYPFGDVFVDVDASQAAEARALLLADEVEAVFVDAGTGVVAGAGAASRSWAVAASAIVVLAAMAVLVATSMVRLVATAPEFDPGAPSVRR